MSRLLTTAMFQTKISPRTLLPFVARFFSSDHEPISKFSIPDPETLPKELSELMREFQKKAGFVPNVYKALSHRPRELKAFEDYYNVVMGDREGGHITKADKEMIIVAVSSHNKCRYCIIAHSALYRIYSKDARVPDQVAANWETAFLDDRQKAILKFAMQVAKCEAVTDDLFEGLYENGMDQEDAWDIGAVVALFSLSNRMAFLTGMIPNEEFYLIGRVPREK